MDTEERVNEMIGVRLLINVKRILIVHRFYVFLVFIYCYIPVSFFIRKFFIWFDVEFKFWVVECNTKERRELDRFVLESLIYFEWRLLFNMYYYVWLLILFYDLDSLLECL